MTAPQPSAGENESFARVSLVPAECGLEPKGVDRPNPMVGFLRLKAEEEVNPAYSRRVSSASRAFPMAVSRFAG